VVLRCRSDGEALRVGGARNVAKQLEEKKTRERGEKEINRGKERGGKPHKTEEKPRYGDRKSLEP
jgi:hypothetical protein